MSRPTGPGPEGPDDARIDAIARGAFADAHDPTDAGQPDEPPPQGRQARRRRRDRGVARPR